MAGVSRRLFTFRGASNRSALSLFLSRQEWRGRRARNFSRLEHLFAASVLLLYHFLLSVPWEGRGIREWAGDAELPSRSKFVVLPTEIACRETGQTGSPFSALKLNFREIFPSSRNWIFALQRRILASISRKAIMPKDAV